MSKDDNKEKWAKAALVEMFHANDDGSLKLNEDGTRIYGCSVYVYFEMGSDIVDFGDYFSYGDGEVCLVAEDGKSICCPEDIIDEYAIDEEKWRELVCGKDYRIEYGRWAEWLQKSCDCDPVIVRVTGLKELPKISRGKTIGTSCLRDAQKQEIKIYGVPLLCDGDVTRNGQVVLRRDLHDMLCQMWKDFVLKGLSLPGGANGVNVDVVDYPDADGLARRVKIEAGSEAELHSALKAIGVSEPCKVKVEHKCGTVSEGDKEGEADLFMVDIRIVDRLK